MFGEECHVVDSSSVLAIDHRDTVAWASFSLAIRSHIIQVNRTSVPGTIYPGNSHHWHTTGDSTNDRQRRLREDWKGSHSHYAASEYMEGGFKYYGSSADIGWADYEFKDNRDLEGQFAYPGDINAESWHLSDSTETPAAATELPEFSKLPAELRKEI
ncbi:Uu.00g112190.m01.CDS01 [Anthostomella pinea]|uniref:Uu.00g112190.m01.CDS01 n=1 Tax=Anthostomella pinea TaxID=933095 RepID=A0AAI8YGF9_9PEZI|nr:Uu.00g112190.m01.CDS01 [Anthostomella pinea]